MKPALAILMTAVVALSSSCASLRRSDGDSVAVQTAPRIQDPEIVKSVVAIIDPDGITVDGTGFLCIVPRTGARYVITTAHNLERHLLISGNAGHPERALIHVRLNQLGVAATDMALRIVSHETHSDIAVLRIPEDLSIDIVGDNAISVSEFAADPLNNGELIVYAGYLQSPVSQRHDPLVYEDSVTLFEPLSGEPIPLVEARVDPSESGSPVFVRRGGKPVFVGMLQAFKKDFIDLYTKAGDLVPNNERFAIVITADQIKKLIGNIEAATPR